MSHDTIRNTAAESVIRRRLEPSERRAQLLEHAISAFADAGIERAAHADVASRAKVSTPTVFKYFPTREALVDAVLSEVELTLEDLKAHLTPPKKVTASELVKTMSEVLTKICLARPDLMKVALIWSVAFSPVRARYLSFESELQDIMASILVSQTTVRPDTYILFATVKVFIRMHFDDTTPRDRRDYINRISEILKTAETSAK